MPLYTKKKKYRRIQVHKIFPLTTPVLSLEEDGWRMCFQLGHGTWCWQRNETREKT